MMRPFISGILIICVFFLLVVLPAGAQLVTADDARSVAENWVTLTIRQQGVWGGSPTAQIGTIREFRQGNRLIGYFCPVSPQGFLVMSLRRELAPVKAYSDTCNLDPDSSEGLADLIKLQMADMLDQIEQGAGPVATVSSANVTSMIKYNYLNSWNVLDTSASAFENQLQNGIAVANYQQGGILLTTQWHQGVPYNNECPSPSPGSPCTNPRCAVGCTGTAGAQVMKYWNWPPSGEGSSYSDSNDWPNMANEYVWDNTHSRWEDEHGNPLDQVDLDAVSELNHEVGVAAGMVYCWENSCKSGAFIFNLLNAYKNNFRYASSGTLVYRAYFNPPEKWFDLLKDQNNRNRPVILQPYREHVVVADGWREFYVGTDLHREFHINYGWENGGANGWYAYEGTGSIPKEDTLFEMALINITPAPALGPRLSGTYQPLAFPYRYFDTDAYGNSATFYAGQNLQFLPGVKATCNSGTGITIRFDGNSAANTRLFTRGDTSKGGIIRSGTVKLKPGGSVKLP